MTPEEKKDKFEQAVILITPEAKEFVNSIMRDPIKTTKDNYGKAMSMLTSLEKTSKFVAQAFLIAMHRSGYPTQTVRQLKQIMSW